MPHLNGCKYLGSSHGHKEGKAQQRLVTQNPEVGGSGGVGNGVEGEITFSPYLVCRSPGRPKRVQNCCILDEEKVAVPGINVTVVLNIQTVTDRRQDTVNKTR